MQCLQACHMQRSLVSNQADIICLSFCWELYESFDRQKGATQVGGDIEVGHEVTLRVLDVNKANGIVELTAKEDLLLGTPQAKQAKKEDKKKKKDKKLAVPQACSCHLHAMWEASKLYAIQIDSLFRSLISVLLARTCCCYSMLHRDSCDLSINQLMYSVS